MTFYEGLKTGDYAGAAQGVEQALEAHSCHLARKLVPEPLVSPEYGLLPAPPRQPADDLGYVLAISLDQSDRAEHQACKGQRA